MSGTILLVEDEHNVGTLIRTYLQRDGFDIIWVRTGEDALTELVRHPVALILLDVGLPRMNGLEVCRRVDGRVPVIMLTARDEEADRVAGLEIGADDYIAKPFDPMTLHERVAAALGWDI